MPEFSTRAVGLVAVLVAIGLSVPVGTSLVSAGNREYRECVNACNATRQACDARCVDDCSALYPAGTQRDACIVSCKTSTCVPQSQDCKLVCKTGEPCPSPPCTPEP